MNDASGLALSCTISDDRIEVVVRNEGTEMARIWRRDNSWGWETLHLLVGDEAHPDERFELRPVPVIWTRNGPEFRELAPNEEHVERIAFGDVTWNGVEVIESLAGRPLDIVPVLDVPPSPEAASAGVFVGRVAGRACRSEPPHRWLFG